MAVGLHHTVDVNKLLINFAKCKIIITFNKKRSGILDMDNFLIWQKAQLNKRNGWSWREDRLKIYVQQPHRAIHLRSKIITWLSDKNENTNMWQLCTTFMHWKAYLIRQCIRGWNIGALYGISYYSSHAQHIESIHRRFIRQEAPGNYRYICGVDTWIMDRCMLINFEILERRRIYVELVVFTFMVFTSWIVSDRISDLSVLN